jgi:hypothetical protein
MTGSGDQTTVPSGVATIVTTLTMSIRSTKLQDQTNVREINCLEGYAGQVVEWKLRKLVQCRMISCDATCLCASEITAAAGSHLAYHDVGGFRQLLSWTQQQRELLMRFQLMSSGIQDGKSNARQGQSVRYEIVPTWNTADRHR